MDRLNLTRVFCFLILQVLSITEGSVISRLFRGFRQSETKTNLLISSVESLDMILSDKRGADQSAQAGLRLCCSQTPKTVFLVSIIVCALVLFRLILNVPVNNFSAMSGRVFLC